MIMHELRRSGALLKLLIDKGEDTSIMAPVPVYQKRVLVWQPPGGRCSVLRSVPKLIDNDGQPTFRVNRQVHIERYIDHDVGISYSSFVFLNTLVSS